MTPIIVTQRVAIDQHYGERRDCLDQGWTRFLFACGLTPMPVPNHVAAALALCETAAVAGIVLTGGNNLVAYGGDAPERDATENALIDLAARRGWPLLGVCRGMQIIQHHFGIALRRISGHVAPHQFITIDGKLEEVNSYHNFGATETQRPLETWAIAEDGVIKAVRHERGHMAGIMWHPERFEPAASRDIALFRQFFGCA
jgi:putative glutamine amidotransferase